MRARRCVSSDCAPPLRERHTTIHQQCVKSQPGRRAGGRAGGQPASRLARGPLLLRRGLCCAALAVICHGVLRFERRGEREASTWSDSTAQGRGVRRCGSGSLFFSPTPSGEFAIFGTRDALFCLLPLRVLQELLKRSQYTIDLVRKLSIARRSFR